MLADYLARLRESRAFSAPDCVMVMAEGYNVCGALEHGLQVLYMLPGISNATFVACKPMALIASHVRPSTSWLLLVAVPVFKHQPLWHGCSKMQ